VAGGIRSGDGYCSGRRGVAGGIRMWLVVVE
jgi:hypothetical protein